MKVRWRIIDVLFFIGVTVAALLPLELSVVIFFFLHPITFLQRFFTLFGCICVFGWMQVLSGILYLKLLAEIFGD